MAHFRYYQRAEVAKAKLVQAGYVDGHMARGLPPLDDDLKRQVQEVFDIKSTWANTTASVRFAFLPEAVFSLVKKVEIMYYEQKLKGQTKGRRKTEAELDAAKAEEEEAAEGKSPVKGTKKRKRKPKQAKVPPPARLKPIPRNFFESLATNLSLDDAEAICMELIAQDLTLEVSLHVSLIY